VYSAHYDAALMTNQWALEVVGLSKRYGNRAALSNVDLMVPAGTVHGLLGPNGAGKTTLMRILLGLIRPDSGSVTLHAAGPMLEGVAGFVETPAFYPYLSGRRNLELIARLDGTRRSTAAGHIEHTLDEVGLTEHADRAVSGYSAGMRQRLGLAAALVRSPRLLLLDEPTSALDPAGARDVCALARRLSGNGTAVVWCSHDLAEVEQLCATITVLDLGRVVFSGTVEALRMLAPADVHELRTSDDRAALDLAFARSDLRVTASASGLELSADSEALDAFVIALGRAGIAVRHLETHARTLESLFFELTERSNKRMANDLQGVA